MRIGITCYPTYGGFRRRGNGARPGNWLRAVTIFISSVMRPPIRMNLADPHIHFHEVEVASYPLFDHPPYTLALRDENAGSVRVRVARFAARPTMRFRTP